MPGMVENKGGRATSELDSLPKRYFSRNRWMTSLSIKDATSIKFLYFTFTTSSIIFAG